MQRRQQRTTMNRIKQYAATILLMMTALAAEAQIGQHRNDLSIGVNGGYMLSNIGFTPKVNQKMLGGITGGVSFRYVCEKYFSTICSVQAEVNYAQTGWKEDILNLNDEPVINPQTGMAEEYSRTISYIQIPVFAHLAWGREKQGFQFFFQAGPQFGIYLSDDVKANYDLATPNVDDRSNKNIAQETMPIENKFDYGIAAGLGMEYSHRKAGHFQIEGRYYYGLGNIYGDSKKDYFGKSNHGNIVVKLTYLFDLIH